MSTVAALQRGRTAFRSHDWAEAYAQLSAADRIARVASEDLELLATSAYLIGADEVSIDAWAARTPSGFASRVCLARFVARSG